jgi:hypothetical protein
MDATFALIGAIFGPWSWVAMAALAGALTGYGIRQARKSKD